MRILLVGDGDAVYFLTRRFRSRGDQVAIVSNDAAACDLLARTTDAVVVRGDPSDAAVLADAGAREADTLLAMTPSDPDNLIVAQIAADRFAVPHAVAMAHDPDNATVFQRLGVHAFSPTDVVGRLMEAEATAEGVAANLAVAGGRVHLSDVVIEPDSGATDVPIAQLGLPERALIAMIVRGPTSIVPRGHDRLEVGDHVVIVADPSAHEQALSILSAHRES